MRSPLLGSLLLVLGGTLVLVGAFYPEATVLAEELLDPDTPLPRPDRSHWAVIREDLDMLEDPDPDLDAWNYDFYRAEAAGLLWLAGVGVVIASAGLFARSRAAAAVLGAVHAGAWLALGYLAWKVHAAVPGVESTWGLRRRFLWAGVVLLALAVGEALALVRAGRRRRRALLVAVDVVSLLPASFLSLAGAGLYAYLRDNPQWPAGGYLCVALGGLAAIAGMAARRVATPSEGAPCPPEGTVAGSRESTTTGAP